MQIYFLRVWFLSRTSHYPVPVQISNRTTMCRRIITQLTLGNLAQTLPSYHFFNRNFSAQMCLQTMLSFKALLVQLGTFDGLFKDMTHQ